VKARLSFRGVGLCVLAGCAGTEPGGHGTGGSAGLETPARGGGSYGPQLSTSMMPLELGRSWSYVGAPVDASLPMDCPRTATAITQQFELLLDDMEQAVPAFIYLPTCRRDAMVLWESGGVHHGYLLADADDPSQGTLGSRLTVLVDPTIASSFEASTTDATRYEWSALGTVDTPAGSFADCHDRKLAGADSSAVYCRGVGLVRVRSGSQNVDLWLESMIVPEGAGLGPTSAP